MTNDLASYISTSIWMKFTGMISFPIQFSIDIDNIDPILFDELSKLLQETKNCYQNDGTMQNIKFNILSYTGVVLIQLTQDKAIFIADMVANSPI